MAKIGNRKTNFHKTTKNQIMKAGDIIQGTISKCCSTSVSPINGYNLNGEYVSHHYVCNKCRKKTQAIKKDMWVITDKLKYKAL